MSAGELVQHRGYVSDQQLHAQDPERTDRDRPRFANRTFSFWKKYQPEQHVADQLLSAAARQPRALHQAHEDRPDHNGHDRIRRTDQLMDAADQQHHDPDPFQTFGPATEHVGDRPEDARLRQTRRARIDP